MGLSVDDLIDLKKIKKEQIEKKVKEIKAKAPQAINSAVMQYYASASPGNYARTNSFTNFANVTPTESWSDDGCVLTFTFDSGVVSVNSWDAPWNHTYSGDPEQAFTKAWDEGIHGGPKPVEGYITGFWTWDRTQQTAPLGDLVKARLLSIDI